MALLSINEVTTFRWSFEEDVERYATAQIPAIGVWRQKVSDYGEEKAAELLREKGLKVSNLLWAGGFTGSDGGTFRESVEDGLDAVRQAGLLNAPCLVVYSGSRAGHTHNHARRLFKDALKELSGAAAERNVHLAVEPMHPGCAGDWTFLHTVDDTLAILDQIEGNHHLKLVFDTYHLGFEPHMAQRIPEFAHRIGIVHLGDGKQTPSGDQNRCRLGEGMVPLADLVGALRAAGYNGYYDVELIGDEIEPSQYYDLLEHAKQMFARLVGGVK
jgi:sugar phosphate isomerase/epimerase